MLEIQVGNISDNVHMYRNVHNVHGRGSTADERRGDQGVRADRHPEGGGGGHAVIPQTMKYLEVSHKLTGAKSQCSRTGLKA